MTDNERIIKVATATQAEKAKIDAIFNHTDTQKRSDDFELMQIVEVARRLRVSRPTVYRLIRLGKLKVVNLNGCRRVTHQSLVDFVNSGLK